MTQYLLLDEFHCILLSEKPIPGLIKNISSLSHIT